MTNPTGPYGGPQAPQNPYGQQPQPGPNPYGQPQPGPNPYGQPQQQGVQAPPQPGPNPYGQPAPGPNPYGQPQPGPNPYGQPQPGPNPYGDATPQNPYGGVPQNPYGQPTGPLGVNQDGATDGQSVLNKLGISKARAVGLVALLLVGGGFAIFHYISSKSDPKSAAVGDCLSINENAGTSKQIAKSAKLIACTDSSAAYKVLGRINDSSDTDKCSTVPGWKDSDAALYQESLSSKNTSYVLCLEPTK